MEDPACLLSAMFNSLLAPQRDLHFAFRRLLGFFDEPMEGE